MEQSSKPKKGIAYLAQALILFGFLAGTVFLRLPTFSRSVIDWDESLYLLMARSMLQGQVPYVAVWDHKPPLVYLLFALSQIVFPSVTSIRILACIAIAIACYLLYRFGRDVLASSSLGLLAGILYAVFSLKSGGLASNTEIFFTPFTILGFYLLCRPGRRPFALENIRPLTLVASGLAFGLALQAKYVAGFDLAAALVLILIATHRAERKHFWPRAFTRISLVLAGVLGVFLLPLLYFWAAGHLEDYVYANFAANLIHSRNTAFQWNEFRSTIEWQIKGNLILWTAVGLAPFLLYVQGRSQLRARADLGFLGLWLALGFIGVSSTKRYYDHYFLQLLPALCLIAAYVVINLVCPADSLSLEGAGWRQGGRGRATKNLLLALVLILGLFPPLYDHVKLSIVELLGSQRANEQPDVPRLVAAYLNARIAPESYLYVVDTEPILYYLVQARCPTRYAFPPFLLSEHFARVAGVDSQGELDAIMRLQPAYVVMEGEEEGASPQFYASVQRYLDEDYSLETTIGPVQIYRRRG